MVPCWGARAIIISPNDDSWIVLGRSAMCRDYFVIGERRRWRLHRLHRFLRHAEHAELEGKNRINHSSISPTNFKLAAQTPLIKLTKISRRRAPLPVYCNRVFESADGRSKEPRGEVEGRCRRLAWKRSLVVRTSREGPGAIWKWKLDTEKGAAKKSPKVSSAGKLYSHP